MSAAGSAHTLDAAISLQAQPDGSWLGATSAHYANMVGPFGGVTAAQTLQSVLLHPDRLGEPIAFTINFCAAVADGPFVLRARPARTNRSTQHWVIEMQQQGATVVTATAVTALRRETWGADEVPMPTCPAPEQVARQPHAPLPFVNCYELRPVQGDWPAVWDGTEKTGDDASLTHLWIRDHPPRPVDYAALLAYADIFFPRVFVRRAKQVAVGTVSMTVYFHADAAQLQDLGDGYVLGQARGQAFRKGFFDQAAQLWSQGGAMLASSHQTVYYKE